MNNQIKYILILLGPDDEYLGYKSFLIESDMNKFLDELEPLMIANIENKISLKDRLKLLSKYFPFAGRVQDIEVIEL